MNEIDTVIRSVLRPIRGCATDDQYKDCYNRLAAVLTDTRAKALEDAAKIAKTAWLSDVGTIGDAEYGEALCAAIDEGIRALASAGGEKGE